MIKKGEIQGVLLYTPLCSYDYMHRSALVQECSVLFKDPLHTMYILVWGLHDVKSFSLFVSIEHKVFFHFGEQRNKNSYRGVGIIPARPNSPRGMNDIQTRIRITHQSVHTQSLLNLSLILSASYICIAISILFITKANPLLDRNNYSLLLQHRYVNGL